MKLGLIGKPLGHSWSPEIHRFLTGTEYSLWETEPGELESFLKRRDFDGINVTIPYKKAVMQYLDDIDEAAGRIGAVNCIVNRDGRLTGYNTDYQGLRYMIEAHGMSPEGGTAAVLGTGGAGRMAEEVCRQNSWDHVIVSSSGAPGSISYDELYEQSRRITMIINATPVGMFPDIDRMPVDPAELPELKYVVDIVANPVRTRLMQEAEAAGIRSIGGAEMLVSQAHAAEELFTGSRLDPDLIGRCVESVLGDKLNMVLIGMPSAGKSTIGRLAAERLGRRFVDTDDLIVDRIGMPIREYFARNGEEAFRDIETEVARELAGESGLVIATGGGICKRRENMLRLRANGRIYWIDRDPEMLVPTDSRPLSSSREDLMRLYEERCKLYSLYSDLRIVNNTSIQDAIDKITG